MTNHPLFGFQTSLVIDRVVVTNNPTDPNTMSFRLIQTDMSGRGNKRFLRLADAEADFVATVTPQLNRPDSVSFDPLVLRNLPVPSDEHAIAATLRSLVNRQANQIALRTRRAKGNSVIVSRWALAHLLPVVTLDSEPSYFPHGKEDSGLVYMGVINNEVLVYLLPTMPASAPLLVTYTNREDNRDAGAFLSHVSGMYHLMIPDSDPQDVVTKWTDYFGAVPVVN